MRCWLAHRRVYWFVILRAEWKFRKWASSTPGQGLEVVKHMKPKLLKIYYLLRGGDHARGERTTRTQSRNSKCIGTRRKNAKSKLTGPCAGDAHSFTSVPGGKVNRARQILELPNQSGGDAAEIGGQAGYPVWDKQGSGADEGEIGPLKAAAHAECDVPREP